jgi:hypothetical protein
MRFELFMLEIFLLGALTGIVLGQMSVWRVLRRKRFIEIEGWIYTAFKSDRESAYSLYKKAHDIKTKE